MRSYRKELWFNVPTRRAFTNITPHVEECLRESGTQEGLVLVNAMHITMSVSQSKLLQAACTTTRACRPLLLRERRTGQA